MQKVDCKLILEPTLHTELDVGRGLGLCSFTDFCLLWSSLSLSFLPINEGVWIMPPTPSGPCWVYSLPSLSWSYLLTWSTWLPWSNSCPPCFFFFFWSWLCTENLCLVKVEFIFAHNTGSKLKSTTRLSANFGVKRANGSGPAWEASAMDQVDLLGVTIWGDRCDDGGLGLWKSFLGALHLKSWKGRLETPLTVLFKAKRLTCLCYGNMGCFELNSAGVSWPPTVCKQAGALGEWSSRAHRDVVGGVWLLMVPPVKV